MPNHYIKQKAERIVLVPGDDRCVQTVGQIYRRHHVDGWGAFRIAEELNVAGIPSPAGRSWSTTTINQILRNPIYRGHGIANRYSSAIYHMRAPDRPVEVEVEKSELYTRKRPARRTRARTDWRVQDYPQLAGLLDVDVLPLAAAKQQVQLDGQAGGHVPKPNRDRHRDSSYFLKGLLRSRQGDSPMTGITTGKKNSKKRYYRIAGAYASPDANVVLRKLIPADPIEEIVLATVKTTLLSMPDLRDRIERQIRATHKAASLDSGRRSALIAEREAIRAKLEFVIDSFDATMKELVARKISELQGQLRAIEERLARCDSPVAVGDDAIPVQVEATVAAITQLAETIAGAPPATLGQFLRVIISSCCRGRGGSKKHEKKAGFCKRGLMSRTS